MNSERTQAYGRVLRRLEDVGASKLHLPEQARVRDAADTLVLAYNDLAAVERSTKEIGVQQRTGDAREQHQAHAGGAIQRALDQALGIRLHAGGR